MSSIPLPNSIKTTSMLDFQSQSNHRGGLAKSARFLVNINMPRILPSILNSKGSPSMFASLNEMTYLCEAAEMPGRGFVNGDVRYYGPNQKLPVKTQYEDTTMTFLCRSHSKERQFFDDWMEAINPTNSYNFRFREEYETTIHISQFAEYAGDDSNSFAKETYRITLFNAYPLLINPQPMTWADDQFQRLAVTFTYHKWKRVGWDTLPQNTPTFNGFE